MPVERLLSDALVAGRTVRTGNRRVDFAPLQYCPVAAPEVHLTVSSCERIQTSGGARSFARLRQFFGTQRQVLDGGYRIIATVARVRRLGPGYTLADIATVAFHAPLSAKVMPACWGTTELDEISH